MKRFAPLVLLLSCLCSASFAAVTVTLTSPSANSSSAAPIHVVASALAPGPIAGWSASVDSQVVWTGGPGSAVDVWVAVPLGTHQFSVVAWTNNGSIGAQTVQINVTPDGLPTTPPNAVVFDKIEQRNNWGSCHDPGCAGGSGQGVYWMAQYQTPPSLSGSSAEFFNSGVWANALFWTKLGANNAARNFLWDFYFYVDSNYSVSAQALEFDAFQFIGGYNYMIGTECDYWLQIWDTWDEATGHWIHSQLACPHFAPNTWHHMQLYAQTNSSTHQYKYVTMVIDGHSTPVNITGNALYLNWGDNMGVQWQVDVNANGSGYHEWMDNAKLTVW